MSLATSGNLLTATGILHCGVGLLIPEIRTPLLRIVSERSTSAADLNDRYQREFSFWFQFGGIMMISQGFLLRKYCQATKKPPPQWFGWYLTAMSAASVAVMPDSGFWLVLGQGMWILYQGDGGYKLK